MSNVAGPLSGWRILVTRPRDQADALATALQAAGGSAIVYPTIEVGPPPTWEAFDLALCSSHYSWAIFTSPSAVRLALQRAAQLSGGVAALSALQVAAVGAGTARALSDHGMAVAALPAGDDQRQEGLVEALAHLEAGTRILFPQAVGGRELLRDELVRRGCVVDVVPVSSTTPIQLASPPPPFDAAVFASPSALRAFVSSLGVQPLAARVVAVIGPTTAAAAADLGVRVDVTARSPSVPSLVSALVAHREQLRGEDSGSGDDKSRSGR